MILFLPNGIHLTEFRRTDSDALVKHLSDHDIYANTLRIPHPYTPADADHWFNITEEATKTTGENVQWAIRDETEKLIGGIGLEGLMGDHPHRVEMGQAVLGSWHHDRSGEGGVSARLRRTSAS